jgi:nitrite reductase/ring-hydroxylating ferredoxin subunit
MTGARRREADVVWAGSMSELPVGALISVVTGDKPARRICLANVGGRLFAFEDVCPHRGGRLSDGTLVGNVVRCPIHEWGFNVKSGACLGPGRRRLTRYLVESWGGRLTIYSGRPGRRRRLFDIGRLLPSRQGSGSGPTTA